MPMIDWADIDTVLLDMDGTLLDLHFDSHFWREHLPARYASKLGVSVEQGKAALYPMLEALEGTMQWYCLDHWSERLDLDVAVLKQEIRHLIAVHPHVVPFLEGVRAAGKHLVLVTNAHRRSLELKLQCTGIDMHLDAIVCSHDFALPKEQPPFWAALRTHLPFDPARTLLVDDSLPVLRSAARYGLAHLIAVTRPDSRQPARVVTEFPAIRSFAEIMP